MTTEFVRRRYIIDEVVRNIRLEPAFWEALDACAVAQGHTTRELITIWRRASRLAVVGQYRLLTGVSFQRVIRLNLVEWLLDERDRHRSRLPTERPWRPR